MTTIPNQCAQRNTQAKSETDRVWIIRGPHRQLADASAMHALALQGWFLIRTAAGIQAHYADVEEGSA